jgi:hypothetical protein
MFVSHERAVFMAVFNPTYILLLFRRSYEIGMGNVGFQTALGELGLSGVETVLGVFLWFCSFQ